EAQLAPPDLIRGRAAGRRDLGLAVLADPPLVAVLVAPARVGVRQVLRERDVIVGVDQPGRDDAVGAGDHDLTGRGAVAADAGDHARPVHRDLAAAVHRAGRQDVALEQLRGPAAADLAGPRGERRQR